MALPALVPPDNTLGNYRIVSRLASGGMGVVYKAVDEKLQRTVALKFLAGESDMSAADRNRLLHEARAASALDHENIAAIHAVEEAPDGRFFIVMSFYEGENLATRMSHAPLSTEQSISVVRQVSQGLAHAHTHNIIHRDIKPSNIILCNDGVAKIVDFGLARVVTDDATQSLGVSGTLPYMSPEQVTGKAVDHRTDIWSLGVVMYELLTQRHPFPADSPAAMIAAIAKAQPPVMIGVPEPLQAIVYRALAKRPEDRYQDCLELLRDLEPCVREATATAPIGKELKNRIDRAGSSESHRIAAYSKWFVIALIILAGFAISPSVRKDLSARWTRLHTAASTTPAAFESYEKGMEFLKYSYRPNATGSAISEFTKSISADAKFALAYVGLGQAYFFEYRLKSDATLLEKAEANARTAVQLNSQLSEVYTLLARLELVSGNSSVAVVHAQHALELDPQSAQAHLAQADVYSAIGRIADADQEYEQGIALDPELWEGYYRRGMSYARQQRYQEAAVQLRHALEFAPDNAYAHTNLAVMLKALHQDREAEAELKKALEYGEIFSAYGNLANLYYNEKRISEAIDMTKRALRLNEKNHMLWNNLGVYYDALGDTASANDAYEHELVLLEEQIRLNPRDATMRSDLALQYAKRKIANKAILQIQAALALQPKDPRILQIAGEIYYKLGDRARAVPYLRRSIAAGNTVAELDRDPDLRTLMSDPKVRSTLDRERISVTTAAKKTAN
ncbi:MAG: protein kinase domain-containing protein [Acidobacteriaceae bacterium]